MAKEVKHLINYQGLTKTFKEEPTILVIGLGNWNATPDALGPRVIHNLLVTRPLYDNYPADAREGMRPVCALAPGVLGLTGIETAEIIKGTIDRVHPDLVIAIDALAARSTSRLASTIQISNTGIYPGSGLGKKRTGITKEDMGVPVIALGVPTVVNSVTIVSDTIDKIMSNDSLANTEMNNRLRKINENQKKQVIHEILQPYLGDLVMAPKGIDRLIRDVAKVVAGGLNVSLHPDITEDNLSLYLQ
jgi:spore protease